MSAMKKLICCCAGGGDISDLKRLGRQNGAGAAAAAAKKELAKGKSKSNGKKVPQSVKMKAELDLDNEGVREPDVVTSHQTEDNAETPDQQNQSEAIPESLSDGKNPGDEKGDNVVSKSKREPVEEEIFQTRVVKEVHMSPPSIEVMDPINDGTKPVEETATPTRAVHTASLTLSIGREKPKPVIDEASSGSPSKMRGGKSGRSLFQLRHSGTSDTSPTTSPVTMPVDKVLLVKSKDTESPTIARSFSSSSSVSDTKE